MKLIPALILGLPAYSAAYPGMGSMSKAEVADYLHKRQLHETALEERQVLSGVVTGLIGTVQALTNTVSGLLGAVANNISPSDKRPEPGYEFQAPGPSDSRGPCPGLNLLANHGYLPRNGHVTFQQVLEATSRGFNMGADLATILATFAVLADGDIASESFYLGSLTGADGLNRHSTVEADVSPNREGKPTPSLPSCHPLTFLRLLQRLRRQPPPLLPPLQAKRRPRRRRPQQTIHPRRHDQAVRRQRPILQGQQPLPLLLPLPADRLPRRLRLLPQLLL